MRSVTSPRVVVFGTVLAVALVLALFPFFPRQLPVREGDVASNDIRSPVDRTFESDVLTEQEKETAAQVVREVFRFEPSVPSAQLAELIDATGEVLQVRQDDDLTATEKRGELLGIVELGGLSRASIDTILALSGTRWQEISNEAEQVLAEVMTTSIAPEDVEAEQNRLTQRVSANLSAREAGLVADLVRPLIVPTLVTDEESTAEARDAARQGVQPVQQTVAKSQLIVGSGQLIDAATLELLEEVGLLEPRLEWRNLIAVSIIAILVAAVMSMYVWRFPIPQITSDRNLVLLALLIALPVLVARLYFSLVLPEPDEARRFLAYFLPLATAPMLIATLLGARLGLVIGFVQAVLMTFVVVYLPDFSLVSNIEPVDVGRVLLVYGFGAAIGVFAVQRAERTNQYVLGGGVLAVSILGLLFATWLIDPERRAFDAVWMTAAAASSGIGSGLLVAGGITAVGTILGVTTRVQLMELSQLNAPLLRRLQDEAPGTFHHSVIVANLAERAADLIGADSLLVRVGCYYHDIGKVVQPGFYIENQLAGDNPHDGMDPKASARVIAQHVQAGTELAKRHGLPALVQDFIPQHHGTRLVSYFYRIASQQDPSVDESLFRYPGPKPQTRETALVMLADSTEAVARAAEDRSAHNIDRMVEQVLSERLAEGELDECDLTLRDMRRVADSFKQTLSGVYHPRVAYPEPTVQERRALIGRFRPGRRTARPGDGAARTPPVEPPPDAKTPTRGPPST